jgi:hypothetical protein
MNTVTVTVANYHINFLSNVMEGRQRRNKEVSRFATVIHSVEKASLNQEVINVITE